MPDDNAVVESVARAISVSSGLDPDDCVAKTGFAGKDLSKFTCTRVRWQTYTVQARAAIAAYRDAVAGGGEEG